MLTSWALNSDEAGLDGNLDCKGMKSVSIFKLYQAQNRAPKIPLKCVRSVRPQYVLPFS